MVGVPRTLYAKSDDTYLAYQVLGAGPLDVVVVGEGFISIDSVDDEPSFARFNRRLASFSRLVRFDRRGVGLSDPVSPSNPPTLEQLMHDALAVMDAAGVARAAVLSLASAKPAVMLAVAHPHRVSSLVVVNGFARTLSAPDYPAGWSPEEQETFDVSFQPDAVERGVDVLALVAPSVAHDEAFRAWWDRAGSRGASPAMARAIAEMSRQVDVRSLLESIQVPTLVLHRRDDRYIRVGHGRYLAEHIPDAKYVELEGADHLPFQGDTDVMLDEIEEFLTGVRHGLESDRSLAAVLFTDIVGSTERIAELGETRWRDLLDRHDAALRRQLQRFRGREIKTTGDGFLATFDGPAGGVQCACAIRDAAGQLGLAVRAGIHVGEVELRGPDIAGMTVHVTARIQALAESARHAGLPSDCHQGHRRRLDGQRPAPRTPASRAPRRRAPPGAARTRRGQSRDQSSRERRTVASRGAACRPPARLASPYRRPPRHALRVGGIRGLAGPARRVRALRASA